MSARPVFLYLMRGSTASKVGVSFDVEKRLRTIQNASWEEICIIESFSYPSMGHACDAERKVHILGKKSDKHVSMEWFEHSIIDDYKSVTSQASRYQNPPPAAAQGNAVERFLEHYTVDDLQSLLSDRMASVVSRKTGVNRNLISAIKDGKKPTPRRRTLMILTSYFKNPDFFEMTHNGR